MPHFILPCSILETSIGSSFSIGDKGTLVLPELSRTMAYTTRKTVNRLARKQLHLNMLNHVVSERPKEKEK